MNISFHFAKRYLFSNNIAGIVFVFLLVFLLPLMLIFWLLARLGLAPRLRSFFGRLNAINIISGISVLGIAIGTAVLILILSVFNGFEDLISQLFSRFNPDVKVTLVEGKTFEADSVQLDRLRQIKGVEAVSAQLEEIAFFEFEKVQDFGLLKGVDNTFKDVVAIDSSIIDGRYLVQNGEQSFAVLGSGIRGKLGVNVNDDFATIKVYMPKRKPSAFGKPYRSRLLKPEGVFYIQQEIDNDYVLTSLDFARELLGLPNQLSALEIKLDPAANQTTAVRKIRDVMGPGFTVKDRYQQDEAYLKVMNMEKWMAFALLTLTMVLVAFNLVGSLWMIVLEKKKDIAILKAMGATRRTIQNIFLWKGLLLGGLGIGLGFTFALVFYGLQKSFGLISVPAGFIINAYPISLLVMDFLLVALMVWVVGTLASVPASIKARRIPMHFRND